MPDPTVSDALAEAYALAPSDDLILHTIELRHPLFVDDDGNPDSIWLVANDEEILANIEATAPIRPGELVRFVAMPFRFALVPIEAGSTPELEMAIDAVNRLMVEQIDAAVADNNQITACYRPFLESDLLGGPQMLPPPVYTLSDIKVTTLAATARARTGVDLRGAYPIGLFTADEYPGLIGR